MEEPYSGYRVAHYCRIDQCNFLIHITQRLMQRFFFSSKCPIFLSLYAYECLLDANPGDGQDAFDVNNHTVFQSSYSRTATPTMNLSTLQC